VYLTVNMVEQLMFRITCTEQLIWYSSWCSE